MTRDRESDLILLGKKESKKTRVRRRHDEIFLCQEKRVGGFRFTSNGPEKISIRPHYILKLESKF